MSEFKFRTPVLLENGKTIADVLVENLDLDDDSISRINESLVFESEDPKRDRVEHKGRFLERYLFTGVYADYKNYPDRSDILLAMGFRPDEFGTDDSKQAQNMAKSIQRIIAAFNATATEPEDLLPVFKDRKRHYVNLARKEHGGFDDADDGEFQSATLSDINAGRKGRKDRTSRVLAKINNEDVMQGEFYNNITRIKKSHWRNWLRLWDRTKSAVSRDVTLFGREWAKHFIMGYQVEANLFFEIWYNSIDSTFTVHDGNGNELSQRVKTMTEAMRNMIQHIVQSSPSDAAVFRGSNPEARQISRSITNALFNDTDQRAKQLQQIDNEKSREERLQRRMRRKEEQAARERVKTTASKVGDFFKAAAADEEENKKFFFDNSPQDETVWKKAPTEDEVSKFQAKMDKEDAMFKARKAAAEEDARKQRVKDAVDVDSFAERGKTSFDKNVYAKDLGGLGLSKDEPKEKPEDQPKSSFEFKDIETREKAARKRIEKKAEQINSGEVKKKSVNENVDPNLAAAGSAVQQSLNAKYDGELRNMKNSADKSRFTQEALKALADEGLTQYEDTRVPNVFINEIERMLNMGRSAPIVLPTDKPSLFKRAKAMILGQRYRSDFIIGFSLAGKVNLEVWYVTEPNPEFTGRPGQQKTVSSFYVFDVTSMSLIRKNLPYYRNAVQAIMAKLGAF